MMKQILTYLLIILWGAPTYAHVALLTPQGGDTLIAGQETEISWQEIIMHDTQNWDILFSSDGGQSWSAVATDIAYGQLNYVWTVPDIPTAQARIQIVQDNIGVDYSDISGDFTILANTSSVYDVEDNAVVIYPNPTTGTLTIASSKPGTIKIFNASGEYLKTLKGTIGEVRTSLAGYSAGEYYFLVSSEDKRQIYKVVKN